MALLVLRLTLVPTTVLVASIVQRRLGPALGGRVVGWPLTTGPVSPAALSERRPVRGGPEAPPAWWRGSSR